MKEFMNFFAYTTILVAISLSANTISFLAFECCLSTVPVKDKTAPLPDCRGQTNWGLVSQNVDKLTFTGHSHWYAEGHIQKDGMVYLLWIDKKGRRAISLYERVTKTVFDPDGDTVTMTVLMGHWGYEEHLEIKEGVLVQKEGHEEYRDTIHWRK